MRYRCRASAIVKGLVVCLLHFPLWSPLWSSVITTVSALQISYNNGQVTRRSMVRGTAAVFTSAASPSVAAPASIASRLETDILKMPSPSYASKLNGVDNTYFPSFLAGEWDVTQTLIGASAPLGLKYMGGPNGIISIAQASLDQARLKIGDPVELRLRYIPTKWGVAEDRLYNSQQRLDAFAGKTVVASYADVGSSNRPSVLAMGGTEDDPLQTTLVYFKGPAAQKSFLVSHGGKTLAENSSWGQLQHRGDFSHG